MIAVQYMVLPIGSILVKLTDGLKIALIIHLANKHQTVVAIWQSLWSFNFDG